MCIDCIQLWKGISLLVIFLVCMAIIEIRKVLVRLSCVGSKITASAKRVNTRTLYRIQYSIFQVRQEIGNQMTKLNTLYIEMSSALIEGSTKDEILTAQIENIQNQIDLLRKIVAMRNSENL